MRLTTKFLLAMIAAILVTGTVDALLRVRRVTARTAIAMAHHHEFVGRAMRATYLEIARTDGAARALGVLHAAETGFPDLRVRVIDPAATSGTDRARMPPSRLAALSLGRELAFTEPDEFITYCPMMVPGVGLLAVEVSEPMSVLWTLVHESAVRNVEVMLMMSLATGVLAALLGYWFIGRPMSLLADKARRIGAGDLSGPLPVQQRDEVATLAREMNAMCDRLAEAQRALTEQTEARIAALEQLRHADRLRTVGQLASGLAHEMGTPLNVVRGRAQLLGAPVVSDDQRKSTSQIIVDQADRMAALIRQLLDFARRSPTTRETVDLQDVAARSVELLQTLAQAEHVELSLRNADAPVPVEIDPGHIEQVVSNLVVNAIQAVPKGGHVIVEVGCARLQPPADVGGGARACGFIAVVDDGDGIASDDLLRIFEPFFTTKDVGEGTGLGLSVAYAIAREHHGWIDVASRPQQGSRFTLHLPTVSFPPGATETKDGVA